MCSTITSEDRNFKRKASLEASCQCLISLSSFDNQGANDCNLEPVAYEFFTQAFVLYEEEIAVIDYNFKFSWYCYFLKIYQWYI